MENPVQRYNVLCVTKRSGVEYGCTDWHTPITGVAEVFVSHKKELGVNIFHTVVRFQGSEHELLYVRSGLRGTAVTIAIKRPEHPYCVWELYTDTPVSSSVEEVRMIAQAEIAKHGRL